jgi:hypothetical protein
MEQPLFCDRCSTLLTPGRGDFFVVSIEAVCDPSPPIDEIPPEKIREEIQGLLAHMEDVSEQEAMDQVFRRLTLYLCTACFRAWIENPTGS